MEGYIIFDLVKPTGKRPDAITFTSVTSGYCLVAKMEEAFRIPNAMVPVGVRPSLIMQHFSVAVVKMEESMLGKSVKLYLTIYVSGIILDGELCCIISIIVAAKTSYCFMCYFYWHIDLILKLLS